ncbi:hypothetical protein [Thermomonospora umbrina]|uniref:Uncharacterized protein n=1 Tax=Thermomonospora umbrina TaxID=111806 RepID=A0A3D9SXX0_9ACTN|nr:hypothetical protein [Thermomonospora umbrina]REF00797.1 hypothetical protein DFJ69_6379 [Thermomonospora umbrina]
MKTKTLAVISSAALIPASLTAGTGTAHARTQTQPVGAWNLSVTVNGESHSSRISFTSAGKVCLATEVSSGRGYWWKTGSDTFRWVVKEVFQPLPGLPGHILIDQQATQSGAAFTSTGTTYVYDTEGELIGTSNPSVVGTRVSTTPDASCT